MDTVRTRAKRILLGISLIIALKVWILYRSLEYRVLCASLMKRNRLFKDLMLSIHREFRRHPEVDGLSMTLGWTPGYSEIEHRAICWEAPMGLAVWIDGRPAFGVGLEFYANTIRIRQLQGVKGVKVPYALRDWPKRLVKALRRFALLSGMRGVYIGRAHMSLFFHMPHLGVLDGEDPKAALERHQNRMRMRYDETAKSLGFELFQDWGVWHNPRSRA